MNIALEISNGEQLVKETPESFEKLLEAVGFDPPQRKKKGKMKTIYFYYLKQKSPQKELKLVVEKLKEDLSEVD